MKSKLKIKIETDKKDMRSIEGRLRLYDLTVSIASRPTLCIHGFVLKLCK
jgi:hypothetical protein